jgi:hypothetical protein
MFKDDNNKILKLGKKTDNSHLEVSPLEILFALEFYDELHNCLNLSRNLYRALKGEEYETPFIRKNDRMPEEMVLKEEEIITITEVEKYLNS